MQTPFFPCFHGNTHESLREFEAAMETLVFTAQLFSVSRTYHLSVKVRTHKGKSCDKTFVTFICTQGIVTILCCGNMYKSLGRGDLLKGQSDWVFDRFIFSFSFGCKKSTPEGTRLLLLLRVPRRFVNTYYCRTSTTCPQYGISLSQSKHYI